MLETYASICVSMTIPHKLWMLVNIFVAIHTHNTTATFNRTISANSNWITATWYGERIGILCFLLRICIRE